MDIKKKMKNAATVFGESYLCVLSINIAFPAVLHKTTAVIRLVF